MVHRKIRASHRIPICIAVWETTQIISGLSFKNSTAKLDHPKNRKDSRINLDMAVEFHKQNNFLRERFQSNKLYNKSLSRELKKSKFY